MFNINWIGKAVFKNTDLMCEGARAVSLWCLSRLEPAVASGRARVLERLTCSLQCFSMQRTWLCSCGYYSQILALFVPQARAVFRVLVLSHSVLIAKYQVEVSVSAIFLATPKCPSIKVMPQCDFRLPLDSMLCHLKLSLTICQVILFSCVSFHANDLSAFGFILNTE